MQIRKLEIIGFKSFVDRTVLTFDHDVTCIVGPNGCGKSNVVDAIRWVMGEMSAKNLRGRAMEDVIFNGSESRGPHGFAEVTITFDNADGLAPPEYRDYAEIAVTRRLDREGNSDYAINRTPVRLMDVTNLFLGTGVGRKAYSIIEQGRIGFIVSARPEDRRHLIEEAAGITKFKARKKAAERKMDQTRQNLLRVGDIVAEIEKSLASLKRQAQKAERYKLYRGEIRDLELHVASHRWLELTTMLAVVRSDLDQVSARADGARLALRIREAEVEAERLAVYEAEAEVDAAQRRAYELDNATRALEGEVRNVRERVAELREREARAERELAELAGQRDVLAREQATLRSALAELEAAEREASDALAREQAEHDRRRTAADDAAQVVAATRTRASEAETRIARAEAVLASFERRREEARARLDKMRAEREALDLRVAELGQEADEMRARLEGLRGGREQTGARKAQLEAELQQLRAEIQQTDRALERLRGEAAEKRSRLRTLEQIQQRFEGVGSGPKAVLTHFRAEDGVVGLLADRLDCPHELVQALAGVLGEKLSWIVVENAARAEPILSWLAEGKRGRATLIPRQVRRVVAPLPRVREGEGVLGWLADLIRYAPEDESMVRHLLGEVLVVDSLATAQRLQDAGVPASAIVSLDGTVLAVDGRITGGSGEDAGAHMLDVKREIRELHVVVGKLEADLSAVVKRHGELRSGIAQRQAELDGARTEAHDAEIAIVKAEKDLRRAEDDAQKTRQRAETLGAEVADLAGALDAANDEENEARAEIAAAQSARETAEQEHGAADEVHRQRRTAVEEQTAIVTEVKVRAAQAQQKAEGDRAAMHRLERSVAELDARDARLRGEILEGAAHQGELAAQIVLGRERLSETVASAFIAQQAVQETRAKYDAAKERIGAQEATLKETRARIEADGKRVTDLTLTEREMAIALQHLLDQVMERHRIDVRRVIGDYHLREIPDVAVRARIDELLRLVERMGEINLTAIEEYDEQAKRHAYLSTQKADLEEALLQLDRAIRQMNKESRRMFRETFETVNERFKVVFPKLFGGGRAELQLTNPDDLLESGVEIIAQPPGKKLGSIELMSGGEKALTAVSLIFAIFQHKPSPFCLLDEVDAPLDEANIGRFCEAIRQMTGHSQFILITHSKRTMELGDVLYGVTMETPGISKLVSVELRQARARSERPPQAQAQPDVAVA